jgi:hypothetical protein
MSVTKEYIDSFEGAISVAFRQAEVKGMKSNMAHLFATMVGRRDSQDEVERLVAGAIRSHYGKETEWETDDHWRVAVPLLRYEARGLPSLVIETRAYVVASAEVTPRWSQRSWYVTVAESLGKPETTVLPLCFLQSLLDGNEGRYRIVGKDGQWTSREVAGLKQPLRLHDEFVNELRHQFKLKPVADWIEDFGSQGHSLVPLVVGALLGLKYRSATNLLPAGQQAYSQDALIEVITGMGYSTARAQKVLERAESELRAGMTLEEAIGIVLRHIGEEA